MIFKAVFFDVDGVLLDTLPAHIQVCKNLAEKNEPLKRSIPTAKEFKKKIVRGDKEIAPMRCFFKAVGFKEEEINKAVSWYDDNFSDKFDLPCFDGVEAMLAKMTKTLPLGIVTSNVRKNVEGPLAESFKHFTPGCVFTKDMKLSKSAALVLGASYLGLEIEEVLFVGDQKRDHEAAKTVGASFLGVTYGWQFDVGDKGLDLVNGPEEILPYIQSKNDR
ncbi:MAG: HAD family hydrolase [Rhodospirillales bacterium]|nr:HAD family hydrolase [Rhodospirillales bacterium]